MQSNTVTSLPEAAAAMRHAALGGTRSAEGAWEWTVDSTKEAATGPWRPYLEVIVQRFNRSLMYEELLEKVDAVYDKSSFVFSNNFITTFGTDNAVALFRYLGALVSKIDLQIQGLKVCYAQKEAGEGVQEDPRGATLQLIVLSEQLWHIPPLLLLVRAVFGAVLSVRVMTTMRLDTLTGKVVSQCDRVHNWWVVPAVVRGVLGLAMPVVVTLIKPAGPCF